MDHVFPMLAWLGYMQFTEESWGQILRLTLDVLRPPRATVLELREIMAEWKNGA